MARTGEQIGSVRGSGPMVVGAEKCDVPTGFGHPVTLMEVDAEYVDRAAQQIQRHRGRSVGDRSQARQVGSGVVQIAQQGVQHRRRQRTRGHPVGADELCERLRPELRAQHDSGGDRVLDQHVVTGDVTHRKRQQVHTAGRHRATRDRAPHRGQYRTVAVHNGFGHAGGSAGEQQPGRIVGVRDVCAGRSVVGAACHCSDSNVTACCTGALMPARADR